MGQRGNCSTEKFDPATFRFRAALYGPPGSGKTTFGGTWPKPYVYDTDRGLLSVTGSDIEFFQPDTYDEFKSDLAQVVQKAQSGKWDRQSVILDTGSSLYDLIINDALRFGWVGGGDGPKRFEPLASGMREINEQSDYGLSHNRFIRAVMTLKKLPIHLLVIFHEQIDIVEEFGVKKPVGTLQLPGKLPYLVPGLFDSVFRMRQIDGQDAKGNKETKYLIQTVKDGNYFAKCRIPPGRSLKLYEPPDFKVFWEKLVAPIGGV